jgi:predicted dienelactone hydrolase
VRRVCVLALALSLAFAAAACSSDGDSDSSPSPATSNTLPPAEAAQAYTTAGPSPVGVTTLSLRAGPKVEVWYPAVAGTTGMISYDVRDYVPESITSLLTGDVPATFSYPGGRDAPVAEGMFPVVLFSHGFAGMRVQSSFLASHLASWGMIVAAPDHPSRDLFHALSFEFGDASDAVDDLTATLELLRAQHTEAGSLLNGHVDAQQVAAVGHSAGGGTVAGIARARDDVLGYVSLASGLVGRRGGDSSTSAPTTTTTLPPVIDKPTLFVAGANDQIAEVDTVTKPAFERAAAPTRLWVIDKSGHNVFDDFCTLGNGKGIIGVAEAAGLGPVLANPPFDQFKRLGEDGCLPPNAPVRETWPVVEHAVTAWLRNLYGVDPMPVGLGPEVEGQYPVDVQIEERLS